MYTFAENDDLEKLFKEGYEHGVGEMMKEIWFTDKKRQTQQSSHDQASNGKEIAFFSSLSYMLATRGNRWSLVTITLVSP